MNIYALFPFYTPKKHTSRSQVFSMRLQSLVSSIDGFCPAERSNSDYESKRCLIKSQDLGVGCLRHIARGGSIS